MHPKHVGQGENFCGFHIHMYVSITITLQLIIRNKTSSLQDLELPRFDSILFSFHRLSKCLLEYSKYCKFGNFREGIIFAKLAKFRNKKILAK